MCAKTSGSSMWREKGARVRSFQARYDAVEARRVAEAVPADAEAVAVSSRLQRRVQALVDERVRRPVEQLFDQDQSPLVGEPRHMARTILGEILCSSIIPSR